MRGNGIARRQFLALAAAAIPLLHGRPARAQQPERRRIGILMARNESDPEGQRQYAALVAGLAELGWTESRTLQIDSRWRVGDPAGALAAAHELLALKPELLVANATPSLVALQKTRTAVPIVFVSVADPVGQGFVPSLSRPGGNVTGFSVEEASMGGKWLEVLKEAAPAVRQVAVIYNPDTAPYAPMFFPAMQAAAPGKGVTLAISPVKSASEVERAIADIGRKDGGGLMVLPDSFMFGQRELIIALTARNRVPAVYPIRFFAADGGLIAYGIDRVELFRRTASYVDRILKGAAPADLPVQQPTKFELTVNVKTAKELGLTMPQSLLLSADEVIE